ncbi:MAG: hypothetical protein JNK67_12830 [Alphaproteobacteria bacterium]|nr:hypothetical protein [Alphaproteobacteria bacterium]
MRYPLTIRPIDTVSLRPRFVVRDADEQAVASLEHDAAVDVSGVLLGRTPCLKVLGGDDFESLLFDVRWHERDDAKTTFLDAKGRTIGSIDALTAKGSDPSCPVTCRRADGSGLFLLHDRRAHTHRLLRWLCLGTSRRH